MRDGVHDLFADDRCFGESAGEPGQRRFVPLRNICREPARELSPVPPDNGTRPALSLVIASIFAPRDRSVDSPRHSTSVARSFRPDYPKLSRRSLRLHSSDDEPSLQHRLCVRIERRANLGRSRFDFSHSGGSNGTMGASIAYSGADGLSRGEPCVLHHPDGAPGTGCVCQCSLGRHRPSAALR